jgi:hypothetical protein
VLSSFNGRIEARADPPHTIELRTSDRGWLSNLFARIIRSCRHFEVGDEYLTDTFTATVLQVTPKQKDVLEVQFDFNLPLDNPSVVLICWDGKSYEVWRPTDEWQLLNSTVDRWSF